MSSSGAVRCTRSVQPVVPGGRGVRAPCCCTLPADCPSSAGAAHDLLRAARGCSPSVPVLCTACAGAWGMLSRMQVMLFYIGGNFAVVLGVNGQYRSRGRYRLGSKGSRESPHLTSGISRMF